MIFDLFSSNPSAYLRRASTLLQEARMARMEHQAAAEHHAALAEMYSERVRRLESEVFPPSVDWEKDAASSVPKTLATLHSLDDRKKRDALTSDRPGQ